MKKLFVLLLALLISQAAMAELPQNYRPLQVRDGDFSAFLLIANDEQLKEFNKPSDQGVHVNKLSKVKVGEAIAFKILFSGMELDKESRPDVTYDLQVYGPDGKKLEGAKLVNDAFPKIKIDNRFSIYDNPSYMDMTFDDTDKPGKYKAVAEVRDNIGKKKIPLSIEFELVK